MKTIWKFPLKASPATVLMPDGCDIIAAQLQDDEVCLWGIVDPTREKVARRFELFGTGQLFPDNLTSSQHLGTVQTLHGFVWHIFETTTV